MTIRNMTILLSLFILPTLASAESANLKLPSFDHLQSKAIDSVDITIGRGPLSIASALVSDGSDDGVATKALLRGIQSVSVRSYTFDTDNAYSMRDIDEVRQQFKSPHWVPLAQVHSSKDKSDVDIYMSMDGDQLNGMALVATEPREFTILNIVGKIDPKNLGYIEKRFGLRQFGMNATKQDVANGTSE